MTLPTARLGTTDMEITRVGFGAWAVGGSWEYGWGPQSDEESISAIRHVVEEYWETMAELHQEGKVRAIGLSNHSALRLEKAEQVAHVDSLQPPFSLIDRMAAARTPARGSWRCSTT